MTATELTAEIFRSFAHTPSREQVEAVDVFAGFMVSGTPDSVMLMRGSAGTGKTSIASAIVKTLHRLGQRVVLMAPTGRAAKVFAVNSGMTAYTIHRRIYRQRTFSGNSTPFNRADNLNRNTLFIVDEASMIANRSQFGEGVFGSGQLLDDLVGYVYSGNNCRMMLIGDRAQLPPVGENESPALDANTLSSYGLQVFECDISEVLRQSEDSGILLNATSIRRKIEHDDTTGLPLIRLKGFADIVRVTGDELIEQISSSYSRAGVDETMVITRSNKRANIYNNGIRNMILGREEELTRGDRIMVVKNNYHWTRPQQQRKSEDDGSPSFLANGDIASVERVSGQRELYGFRFSEVLLRFPDYDNYEVQVTMLTDSLSAEAPSLTAEQQNQLYENVLADYADLRLKTDRMKALREDRFFNALQVKYAYAVTCHKAQGGQWAHVYLDQGYMTDEMLGNDYYHWLYTAFTRATERLYLVNWPTKQVE
jgi:ATP-dependent exoDNAse (exonuclease V) alpha subunit